MSAPAAPDALPDPLPIVPFDGPVDGVVRPPGSKSLTNRALLAAALAAGTSRLDGVLFADDTEAMLGCLEALGARRRRRPGRTTSSRCDGTGGRLAAGPVELDARLSGTTSRFLAAVLALGAGPFRLDGGRAAAGPTDGAGARRACASSGPPSPTTACPATSRSIVSGGATGVGPGGEQAIGAPRRATSRASSCPASCSRVPACPAGCGSSSRPSRCPGPTST